MNQDIKRQLQAEVAGLTARELLAAKAILSMNLAAPLLVGDRADIAERLQLVLDELQAREVVN